MTGQTQEVVVLERLNPIAVFSGGIDDILSKIEREKIEAAERAVREERERIEAEKKKAEAEAVAREANKKHRAKINNEALAALASLDCVMGEIPAKAIVIAIAEGKIPHVKIIY